MRAKLNGKNYRKLLKQVAEHGAANVAVALQGVLRPPAAAGAVRAGRGRFPAAVKTPRPAEPAAEPAPRGLPSRPGPRGSPDAAYVGFRVGASVARGGWARAGESPAVTADRDATVVTVESEFSFAFTKLAAEWVRDTIETSTGTHVASGWFVQGQQTLAPRWFVAARVERIVSPIVLPTLVADYDFSNTEEVLGFRLTPELTVRGGHRARRNFGLPGRVGRPGFTHLVEVSLVWWKRWI